MRGAPSRASAPGRECLRFLGRGFRMTARSVWHTRTRSLLVVVASVALALTMDDAAQAAPEQARPRPRRPGVLCGRIGCTEQSTGPARSTTLGAARVAFNVRKARGSLHATRNLSRMRSVNSTSPAAHSRAVMGFTAARCTTTPRTAVATARRETTSVRRAPRFHSMADVRVPTTEVRRAGSSALGGNRWASLW